MDTLPKNCRKIEYKDLVNPCSALFRVHDKLHCKKYWDLSLPLSEEESSGTRYYEPKNGEVRKYRPNF